MSSYSHPFRCLAPTKRKSLNHRREAERWSDTYLRIEIARVVRRSTNTYVPAYVPKYVPMYTTHVAVHFRPHLTNKEKRQKSSLSSQTPPDRCSQGCHRVDKKKEQNLDVPIFRYRSLRRGQPLESRARTTAFVCRSPATRQHVELASPDGCALAVLSSPARRLPRVGKTWSSASVQVPAAFVCDYT